MCGIVGFVGNSNSVPIIINGLSHLEYRGYDSAGIAVHNGKEIDIVKTKGRISNLNDKLLQNPLKGNLGIGHTRWATHGAPSDLNSHPHASNENVAVVHNGIIENYIDLKEELLSKGYAFVSDTDTETAAHLIDLFYKESGNPLDSVFRALDRLNGSYALGIVFKDFPDKLIAARKDSPLIIGTSNDSNYISSDIPAILEYTRDVYFLEDNEVAELTKDGVRIFSSQRQEIEREVFHVTWDIESAEKGGYEHFMLKEIFEQPRVIRDTILPRLPDDSDQITLDNISLTKEDIMGIDKIYIVACGTAYYAGLVGKYLLERLARIPVFADVASEFRYKYPPIDEKTLMIVISQSGETADTLAALRLAKKAGARIVSIVNAVGSSIARESDDVFYTLAGPEIAVASTKAFSTQVVATYLLAFHISSNLNRISEQEALELKNELRTLPSKVDNILQRFSVIEYFANKYLSVKNVFYIGRGLDHIISMEGSLKLKEIAYLHSEPYAAGELKHGPIALIEENTLVIGLVTQEELFEKSASNLKEVKARGAKILAIAMEGEKSIDKIADDVFYIPRTHWIFAPLLANIPQQLFAYYVAKGLGNDVDKPRNLAKSVTVE